VISNAFAKCVRSEYEEALVDKASKDGCSLCLRDCPERIIIDLDSIDRLKHQKIADLLVISAKGKNQAIKAIALELKSGNLGSPTRVFDQLQGGLDELSRLVKRCPEDIEAKAVVLCRKPSSIDVKALRKKKLKFLTKKISAQVKRCGANISSI